MKTIDFKSRNLQEQYIKMNTAETIADRYPDIEYVDIEVTIHFHTLVCPTGAEEHKFKLESCGKVYLYYPCPNKDCTGHGFDLSTKLNECLSKKQTVEGILNCDGKEDVKYLSATGCSCMTSCKYKFTPVMKNEGV